MLHNSKKILTFALVIELVKHIEVLLLSNDCVTIPGFGGFVAHYIPARIDETDGVFLPPMRAIGFNPQLKLNDSLLVQSYVEVYDISYPEALRRVEEEVETIQDTISREGSCVLDNIGTLTANDEGVIRFAPAESGILTPSLYGLGTLEFPMLNAPATLSRTVAEGTSADSRTVAVVTPAEDEGNDVEEEDDEERALTIRMSWIRNAVAVAAAVIVFFLTATPIANSNLDTRDMSQLRSSIATLSMPKDSSVAPAIVAQKDTAAIDNAAAVDSVKQAEAAVQDSIATPQPVTPTYCLVLASQVKKSNAEYFVDQLHQKGYTDARVYEHNHIVRVVYGSYATEGEAYQQLNRLNGTKEFAEAWVYKIKV